MNQVPVPPQQTPPGVSEALRAADDAWRSGNLPVARAICTKILSVVPDNADALLLSGVITFQEGAPADGIALIRRAVDLAPDNPAAWVNLAAALKEDGQGMGAAAAYGEAAGRLPARTDLRLEQVNLLIEANDTDAAMDACRAGLAKTGAAFELSKTLASLLLDADRTEEAVAVCHAAAAASPGLPAAFLNLAIAQERNGDAGVAMDSYRRAVALDPTSAQAQTNLGFLCMQAGDFDQAEACFRDALASEPAYHRAVYNLGIVRHRAGDREEAERLYRRALDLQPGFPEAHCNLGTVLEETGRLDEAVAAYTQAISLNPKSALFHNNLGNAVRLQGDFEAARRHYEQAVALQPTLARAQVNLGQLLLMEGEFEPGLAAYEHRLNLANADKPDYHMPVWTGRQSLTGKTILLWPEQGAGDAVQFVRYVAQVKALGAKTLVQAMPNMADLIRTAPGVDGIVVEGDQITGVEYQAALMSLPHILGTRMDTVPADTPYLSVPTDCNVSLPDAQGRRRVGVVWAGNPDHKNDHNRSMDVSALAPLLEMADVQMISLQVGGRAGDIADHALKDRVIDAAPLISDYSDTASILSQLDLLISVDTSVAHLAGALNVPTWLMVPYVPDFRWLLGRDDSPWYPSMRLFRQDRAGDWDGVVARIRDALADRAS